MYACVATHSPLLIRAEVLTHMQPRLFSINRTNMTFPKISTMGHCYETFKAREIPHRQDSYGQIYEGSLGGVPPPLSVSQCTLTRLSLEEHM